MTSGRVAVEAMMTLQAFQLALCDLVSSPRLCNTLLAEPMSVLCRYDLTAREQRRVVNVVGQRGMTTNCVMYRVNRITPVYTLLPLTCYVLNDELKPYVEDYWNEYDNSEIQFKHEIDRFSEYSFRRIRDGEISNPLFEEVLRFELAINSLRFMPRREATDQLMTAIGSNASRTLTMHPFKRVARFRHEPTVLLRNLNEMRPLPYDLAEGEFYLLLDASSPEMVVNRIEPYVGRLLVGIESGDYQGLTTQVIKALLESGMAVGQRESEISGPE